MVDLAKIRKKAKKAAAEGNAGVPPAEQVPSSPPPPEPPSVPVPKVVESPSLPVAEPVLEDSETRRLDDAPRSINSKPRRASDAQPMRRERTSQTKR